jgi:REP element-mobilizing transposase RayT
MPNHLHLLIRFKSEVEIRAQFSTGKSLLLTSPTLQGTDTLQGSDTLEGIETKINLPKAISQRFSNLFNGYTQAYNRMFERKGNLFIPRFKRKLVDNEAYFAELVDYIHNNPVHHGFVSNPEDWEFSSWQHSKKQQNTNRAFDMRNYLQ